ncbi:hypothetical protein SAMN04488058_101124 [Deinococcus reticulitermitis]|uniref:Cytochrome P450 n=1 Tax=Deinococcus reticulitermitis TaxID=856736 RepID=A0A1H6RY50_9DEIO|nr:cytochrome P450 [Deinococcus reticulitermitis]SEI60908.1 hypothetical protein SAMN04488058_101124 [Deinococcus reticulitermitis]
MTHLSTGGACPYSQQVADEFRPFDIADPFAFYARAREEAPIFYSAELDYWVVSRYEDVRAIFKDPATFSSENTQSSYKARPAAVQRVLDEGGFQGHSGLSARQPPDHTRIRAFVNKAFTPRRVASLEPFIRDLAERTIGAFEGDGEADLVSQLSYDLPALVIFKLLGVPDEDVPNVKEWALSRVLMNFGDPGEEEQLGHARNLVKYWNYCVALIESRLETPTDDLPGDMARVYNSGDHTVGTHEMASLVYGMLTAGHETTTNLLSNAFRDLLTHREQWERLVADPAKIPGAVEEMLRYAPSVFTWKRKVKKPATVAGVELPVGANVLLLLGSANRDPAQFERGDELDVERSNAREHLAFGLGIHYCLGAPLARLESRVVLEELTRRLPGLRLKAQDFTFAPNTSFRGPDQVLVQWEV